MKNCEQVTNDLLERRDKYVAEQRRKKKRAMGMVTSLCCVCLVALMGIGIWQGGWFAPTQPDQSLEDSLYPGIKDNFDENKGESADNPVVNNKIVINTVNGISADKMNICLLCDDFVEMTREEMIAYYGVDYVPDVPADIKAWEDERSGIYKRNGGTGEVYWDADVLNYSNDDFTRSVQVEVDKGSSVVQDYLFFKGTEEKSVINNVEVLIGLSENGYYYSEFMYNGVGFCIDAKGVTEDEFVAILASIIK